MSHHEEWTAFTQGIALGGFLFGWLVYLFGREVRRKGLEEAYKLGLSVGKQSRYGPDCVARRRGGEMECWCKE